MYRFYPGVAERKLRAADPVIVNHFYQDNINVKLFAPLYQRVMRWSQHPHAQWYLCAVSFMEASFFPVPVVFMLIPMVAAQPQRGWRLALMTTLSSVSGGCLGYLIGHGFIEVAMPLIIQYGYQHGYEVAQGYFNEYGFLALFIAGFTPVPFKLFTIAAGSMSMQLLPFILASLVGRAGQFFLATAFVVLLGPKFIPMVERYVERIGWAVLALVAVGLTVRALA